MILQALPSAGSEAATPALSRVLQVGCGYATLPTWLDGFDQVRLDIDPRCRPDIVASITDMGDVGTYRLVYAEHCLEHLYPHDVQKALGEFMRVLEPGGIAYITVPDLEDVRPTDDVLMITPAGPVSGIDLYYGFRPALQSAPYMAHHTGFVSATLEAALQAAGFRTTMKRCLDYNLLGLGVK